MDWTSGMGEMMDGMGAMMGVGMLFMVFGLVGAVVLIVFLIRGLGGPGMPADKSPLDILKARYARGEIDRETFERMQGDLEG